MKSNRIFTFACLMALLLAMMSSCDKESQPEILDELDEEYELYDYYVDDMGNEGVVAYILKSDNYPRGYKYMIVISADESEAPWGPMNEMIMQKDSASNTELRQPEIGVAILQSMCTKGVNRYPAQDWCFAKNGSGADVNSGSWRLPSFYELRLIFGSSGSNVSSLNQALRITGGEQIDDTDYYWTCIEDYEGYITINGQESDYDQANRAVMTSSSISTTSDKDRWLKKNSHLVRAIKYIYYYDK